ncbi:hypothetical protein [Pseudacidovorax intermedius]|uniref:hypothetical protein n=1 Tax=Pseudacidovorax intermedius TaxID=433924 RepID=UPI000E0B9D93|nr:hypothetical protein [Pseudacidovorax intermedius]
MITSARIEPECPFAPDARRKQRIGTHVVQSLRRPKRIRHVGFPANAVPQALQKDGAPPGAKPRKNLVRPSRLP